MKTLTSGQLDRALRAGLKELRLPSMRDRYRDTADLARRESLSFERFLWELVETEVHTRAKHRIQRWLRESGLPLENTMDTCDRGRLPARIDHHVSVLLEGGFLDRKEHVLAFGPPAAKRPPLLCALGRELIVQHRCVKFYRCGMIAEQLLAAKRDLRLPQLLKRLRQYEALILDDIASVQHRPS